MMNILLTGAFGNVGSSTLDELLNQGYNVRIFELPTKRNRHIAKNFDRVEYLDRVELFWGDLRNYSDVLAAMDNIDVILHVGGIIPPLADRLPELAEAVNVGGTENILRAMHAQTVPPRIVFTSSISVYGDRRENPWIKVTDPLQPSAHDLYGKQKLRAETLVRQSGFEWCVFRLTYITSMDKLYMDPLMFEMPLETCIEICDTKDVGLALTNAVDSEEIWGKILNIAGGDTCRTTFGEYLIKMMALFGLGKNVLPADAFSKTPFHCGWLDTTESQKFLYFQRTTLDSYYAEVKNKAKFTRFFASLFRPIAKAVILGRSPYFKIKQKRQRKAGKKERLQKSSKSQSIMNYLHSLNRLSSQMLVLKSEVIYPVITQTTND
ncbi:MAG: NAD-dependent epimerase/dehydratase family protein [Promethearchaeota archaeon]